MEEAKFKLLLLLTELHRLETEETEAGEMETVTEVEETVTEVGKTATVEAVAAMEMATDPTVVDDAMGMETEVPGETVTVSNRPLLYTVLPAVK